MEFDNIWKNLTSSCKNLTSTRKNLTEFDKILDRPDCTAENSCSKICSRLCQILSNSVKFLQARSRNFPKSVKRELRRFELQIREAFTVALAAMLSRPYGSARGFDPRKGGLYELGPLPF